MAHSQLHGYTLLHPSHVALTPCAGTGSPHFSSPSLCHRYPPTHLSTRDPTETHTPRTCPQGQSGPELTALWGRSAQASMASSQELLKGTACAGLWSSWRAAAGSQGHMPGGEMGQPAGPLFMPQAAAGQLSPRALLHRRGSGKTQGPFKQLPSSRSFPHSLPARALHPNFLPPRQRQPRLALCLPRAQGEAGRGAGTRLAKTLDDTVLLCESLQPSDRPFPAP